MFEPYAKYQTGTGCRIAEARPALNGAVYARLAMLYEGRVTRWILQVALVAALVVPLDVNRADLTALTALGFTASQAAQIVRYRTENGAFLQVEELLAVPQVTRATLAPLRDRLTIGDGPPATPPPIAVVPSSGVRVADVVGEWRNLYGVIVYAVNANLDNAGPTPLRAIRVRLDLLDASGGAVASQDGYNLGAERLRDQPHTALDTLPAIAAGGRDRLRLTVDKPDIARPFAAARLTVVEAR
ncbi:MAG: helix-hairpin-helix domain-containing protein [Candidatus Binatia bacterium]